MLKHKNIDRICCIVLVMTLLLTMGFMGAAATGVIAEDNAMGYEDRLFDASQVHTIDIVMDDWEGFLETCTSEEYTTCAVVIDGESFKNVAIRAKGNTSLSSVQSYGNNRYSFKIEFDHYESGMSYHGLDKLCLNNIIQDKTYMKDYLAYTLMGKMGVAAPLCSFVQIRVNGEEWGLYLAVESVEQSFLERNYGKDYGELYKPDSMSMGGGRGNGREFDMEAFSEQISEIFGEDAENVAEMLETMTPPDMTSMESMSAMGGFPNMGGMFQNMTAESDEAAEEGAGVPELPEGMTMPDMSGTMPGQSAEGEAASDASGMPEMGGENSSFGGRGNRGMMNMDGGMGGGMGSSDVMLQYTDDDPSSYSNIFDSAKTDVSEEDQQRLIASLKSLSEGETEGVVNVDAMISYLVVHNFLCNDDSYTGQMVHNYYLYEEDGELSMIPWDYNLAFGGFAMGAGTATSTVNSPIDSPVSSGTLDSRPMVAWIFGDEAYTRQYHETYQRFVDEIYESGWLEEEITRVTALIAPYVETDATAFFTYEEFQTGAATLLEFCKLRFESISGQLDGTIPSTTDGQNADRSSLVDASNVSLSDLGEFNMGGGMGGGFNRGSDESFSRDFQPTEGTAGENQPEGSESGESVNGGETSDAGASGGQMTPPEGMQMPEGMTAPEGMTMPEGMQMPTGMGMPGGMQMPGMGGQMGGMPGQMMQPGAVQEVAETEQPAETASAPELPAAPEASPAVDAGAAPETEQTPTETAAEESPEAAAPAEDARAAMPMGAFATNGGQNGSGELWLTAGSIVLLIVALVFVKFYKVNR